MGKENRRPDKEPEDVFVQTDPEEWDGMYDGQEDGPPEYMDISAGRSRNRKKWKPRGRKPASIRIRNAAVTVLLAVVVLISVGAVIFLILQVSGKNSLYSRADSTELVSTLSGIAVELGEDSPPESAEDGTDPGGWQEGDIRYKGVHYRYNPDILTFLFLGIDKMSEVEPVEEGEFGGQSDALFLLALDPHKKKASVIGIPRDTMAELEVYDRYGRYTGTSLGQITLQHAYGDGAALSCRRSVEAVSKLFYGLPIHGYCSINMGTVPVLNDAVGGIRLEALETMDFKDFRAEEGEELYLQGMDAYYYLHNRDITSFNSAGRRLQRQAQYLEAYAAAVLGRIKEDITFPVSLYGTLSRYMVTDITVDEVSYLATQAAGYGFSREDMHTLQGETVMGEDYEEFYVDETALYELILEVFYEDVG